MIQEAIILAGGLGTRLRSVVEDVPKCLAPINGIPFLEYVIDYADGQGIEHIIFSVGYKKELIKKYIESQDYDFAISYSEEQNPLGTGGAIKKSIKLTQTDQILVLNGDTLYEYDLANLWNVNEFGFGNCSLCLKPMQNFERYGSVLCNKNNKIISFREKQFVAEGLINTGVYCLDRERFSKEKLPTKFSFEKDYLEANVFSHNFLGLIEDSYFIDIGIPEDFEKAQEELKNKLDDY
jgi:D-glycero-alpha-D-manno-heptose 1-phosphate guanylyltransferase